MSVLLAGTYIFLLIPRAFYCLFVILKVHVINTSWVSWPPIFCTSLHESTPWHNKCRVFISWGDRKKYNDCYCVNVSVPDWLIEHNLFSGLSKYTYIIEFRPLTDKRGTKPPTTIWPNPWRHRNLWPQSWYKVGRKVSEVARLLKTTVNSDEIQKNYSSKIGLLKSV